MANRRVIVRILVHVLALLPLILLIRDILAGDLSANPIRDIQLRTGSWAIRFLMLSLACTPAYILTGIAPVLKLRRTLGLYAFFYALLHFINFIGVDYGFDFGLLRQDLFEKRYAIVGFASFVLLLVLAVTSIKRLRLQLGKNWQRLHWLVYLAAALAVVHYIWQTKAGFRWPFAYAGILALLLIIRLPIVRNFAERHLKWRQTASP
jgi:sulfoxide reductase heme-binding subunit YedZ